MEMQKMTEKRFTIHKENKYKEEWYAYPFCIKYGGDVVFEHIPLQIAEEIRDKLNEKESTIDDLKTIIGYLLEDMLYSEKFLDYLVENGDYTREEIDKTKRDQTMIIKLILKHGLLKPEEINDDFKSFL